MLFPTTKPKNPKIPKPVKEISEDWVLGFGNITTPKN